MLQPVCDESLSRFPLQQRRVFQQRYDQLFADHAGLLPRSSSSRVAHRLLVQQLNEGVHLRALLRVSMHEQVRELLLPLRRNERRMRNVTAHWPTSPTGAGRTRVWLAVAAAGVVGTAGLATSGLWIPIDTLFVLIAGLSGVAGLRTT